MVLSVDIFKDAWMWCVLVVCKSDLPKADASVNLDGKTNGLREQVLIITVHRCGRCVLLYVCDSIHSASVPAVFECSDFASLRADRPGVWVWALAFPSAAAGLHPNPQQKPQVGFPESSIPGTNSMTFHH